MKKYFENRSKNKKENNHYPHFFIEDSERLMFHRKCLVVFNLFFVIPCFLSFVTFFILLHLKLDNVLKSNYHNVVLAPFYIIFSVIATYLICKKILFLL